MEELNKKLAEWAGFTYEETADGDWHWFDMYGDPLSPTGLSGEPLFTDSLDACFKWLVPKLVWNVWLINADNGWEFSIMMPMRQVVGKAETPALALCKAIEKLIDEEKRES